PYARSIAVRANHNSKIAGGPADRERTGRGRGWRIAKRTGSGGSGVSARAPRRPFCDHDGMVAPVPLLRQGGGTVAAAGPAEQVTEAWLANRRVSDHTRDAYRRDVANWLAWCTARDLNPLTATFLDVNTYAR